MKKLLFFLLALHTIFFAYIVYDLSVFYWSNLDMTDARKFATRPLEYAICLFSFIIQYIGWNVVYKYPKSILKK